MPSLSSPKSEVLTFCQRRALGEPHVTLESVGEVYRVRIALLVADRVVDTGPHEAAALQVAERKAFERLLDELERLEDEPAPGEWLSGAREAELRQSNPKTRLLSSLILRGLPAPLFEATPIIAGRVNAFEGFAVLELPDGSDVYTPVSRSRSKVAVEHANAHDLLAHETVRALLARVPDEIALSHARPLLVELQQVGDQVKDFDIHFLRWASPMNPLFQGQGWWIGHDGVRRFTEPMEAPSKKELESLTTRAILEALRALQR